MPELELSQVPGRETKPVTGAGGQEQGVSPRLRGEEEGYSERPTSGLPRALSKDFCPSS